MSLKAAAAGLDLGGGKAVIIGDHHKLKSERLWRAYGRIVDSLRGRYITAEDVGTDAQDMGMIRRETRWAVGVPIKEGGSGDPSPATARGLMVACRAVARFLWEDEDLTSKHVAVLGVGKVGSDLVRRLHENGCKITVADIYRPATERLRDEYGVDVVEPDELIDVECDILAPCSLGGVLNEETIPRLKTQAIVGSANNQSATNDDGDRLTARDILYAPDFVVNAGGLTNVNEELQGYSIEKAAAHIDRIYDSTLRVLEMSRERGTTPHRTAMILAEDRIREIGNLRLFRRSGDDRN